jgi:hypothetical protein
MPTNEQLLVVYEKNYTSIIYTTVYTKDQADSALLKCTERHSTPGNKVKAKIISGTN